MNSVKLKQFQDKLIYWLKKNRRNPYLKLDKFNDFIYKIVYLYPNGIFSHH